MLQFNGSILCAVYMYISDKSIMYDVISFLDLFSPTDFHCGHVGHRVARCKVDRSVV